MAESKCEWKSHSRPEGAEPCDCEARLNGVTIHTRAPAAHGPDFCAGCSEAVTEWVSWVRCVRRRASALADFDWANTPVQMPDGSWD